MDFTWAVEAKTEKRRQLREPQVLIIRGCIKMRGEVEKGMTFVRRVGFCLALLMAAVQSAYG